MHCNAYLWTSLRITIYFTRNIALLLALGIDLFLDFSFDFLMKTEIIMKGGMMN